MISFRSTTHLHDDVQIVAKQQWTLEGLKEKFIIGHEIQHQRNCSL
jgi:hypothetical protein